jgi:iron complex transport system substrate-binding protein
MKKTKTFKTLTALLLCAALTAIPLTGCSGSKAAVPANAAGANPRTITDILGYKVTLPAKINKIYCTSPVGAVMLYTVDPDKLVSWNLTLSDAQKPFIKKQYQNLPMMGNSGTQFNTEQIIKQNPDIILDFAQQGQVDANVKQLATQTGLPVVEMDTSLEATAKDYRLLGTILGEKKRTEELASYIDKKQNSIKALMDKVPADKQASVYYAESADGLKTDGSDSMHTQLLKFLGIKNVVTISTSQNMKGTAVSMEQVLNWNPSVIIASRQMGGDQFLKSVYQNASWKSISAVKNKKVYSPPVTPFDWFDRPPCITRVLGAQWLAQTLYPETVKIDMASETKTFFSTFFSVNLTDDEVKKILSSES